MPSTSIRRIPSGRPRVRYSPDHRWVLRMRIHIPRVDHPVALPCWIVRSRFQAKRCRPIRGGSRTLSDVCPATDNQQPFSFVRRRTLASHSYLSGDGQSPVILICPATDTTSLPYLACSSCPVTHSRELSAGLFGTGLIPLDPTVEAGLFMCLSLLFAWTFSKVIKTNGWGTSRGHRPNFRRRTIPMRRDFQG